MLEVHTNIDRTGDAIGMVSEHERQLDRGKGVRIGFFDSYYSEGSRASVAAVAMWQEFQGVRNKNKPARPFMREAIQASRSDVIRVFRQFPDNPDRTLAIAGETVKAAIQRSITTGNWAPLAKSTIARRRRGRDGRRSSKPLQDTGLLWTSVTYKLD